MKNKLLYFTLLINLIRGIILSIVSLKIRPLFVGRMVSTNLLIGIRYGKFLRLERGVRLNGLGGQGIYLGNNVKIGSFSTLEVVMGLGKTNAKIELGDGTCIGDFSYLGGAGGLFIGANTITGQYFSCHPENHVWTKAGVGKFNGVTRKGICIGQNCWIGSKVTILDGTKIGDNTIIAAGAVVRGYFPENVLIAGIPARIVKELE